MSNATDVKDGYRLENLLKKGDNTSLYRGFRNSDLLPVVVKLLNSPRPSVVELERFRKEFQIGKLLSDLSSVIHVEEFTLINGAPALVLEDFNGHSLESASQNAMPIEAFLNFAVSMTSALGDIHSRGIIHRDIKPANLIVRPAQQVVKIADFGIAQIISPGASLTSPLGLVEGTLAYISPEQTGRMNRPVDFRSDLYSLGVTFYQLLTGRLPFEADDALSWIHAHIAQTQVSIVNIRPEIPIMISEIIEKLLKKSADDRYQSTVGLKHDLERCLAQWTA